MFDQILKEIQEKIANLEYVVTTHADEEIEADNLSIMDVELAIKQGKIQERQRDLLSGECKYRIRGEGVEGDGIEVIVKIGYTGKIVIITVYAL